MKKVDFIFYSLFISTGFISVVNAVMHIRVLPYYDLILVWTLGLSSFVNVILTGPINKDFKYTDLLYFSFASYSMAFLLSIINIFDSSEMIYNRNYPYYYIFNLISIILSCFTYAMIICA